MTMKNLQLSHTAGRKNADFAKILRGSYGNFYDIMLFDIAIVRDMEYNIFILNTEVNYGIHICKRSC